jgi:hypothetical protein
VDPEALGDLLQLVNRLVSVPYEFHKFQSACTLHEVLDGWNGEFCFGSSYGVGGERFDKGPDGRLFEGGELLRAKNPIYSVTFVVDGAVMQ